ncbi:hypothetical protein AGLY_004789 [Aphis glycines]|uniref:Uncharacterized protein n=1 Tax=Aphis glycines TaxID=307491 RepID=A0A6G0TVT0_APHGL|nr:hypothetical protein AGLY_004789 [Aphis glycines]
MYRVQQSWFELTLHHFKHIPKLPHKNRNKNIIRNSSSIEYNINIGIGIIQDLLCVSIVDFIRSSFSEMKFINFILSLHLITNRIYWHIIIYYPSSLLKLTAFDWICGDDYRKKTYQGFARVHVRSFPNEKVIQHIPIFFLCSIQSVTEDDRFLHFKCFVDFANDILLSRSLSFSLSFIITRGSLRSDLHVIILDTPNGVPTIICGITDSFFGTLSPPIHVLTPKNNGMVNIIVLPLPG